MARRLTFVDPSSSGKLGTWPACAAHSLMAAMTSSFVRGFFGISVLQLKKPPGGWLLFSVFCGLQMLVWTAGALACATEYGTFLVSISAFPDPRSSAFIRGRVLQLCWTVFGF